MDKKNLTAPCGLDCFNCQLYETNITDEAKIKMAAYRKISPEEVPCKGCKLEKGKCFGNSCATYDCAQKKDVAFCNECNEFPCSMLMPTAQGVTYPHNMKLYNLCRMKLIGFDAWVEETPAIRKKYYDGKFVPGLGPVIDEEQK